MSGRLRPFFPYYGSAYLKAAHYPAPAFDEVWEGFAGAAGYSTYHGIRRAHLIDADPVVVGVWEYLLKATPADILALPDLPNVGDCVDDHELSPGAKHLVGFWLNRGSATPKKTRTAYSARSDRGQLNWGPRAKERIASQLEAIAGWTVQHGDYRDVPAAPSQTEFYDPPYEDKGRFYRVPFDRFSELAVWCRSRDAQVIVCEGGSAAWLPFRPLGRFKTSKGSALELVWTNDQCLAEAA